MSTSTPNFNLTKPAGSENVDIATINSNMDKIDAGVEPVHQTASATGSNGTITISNALLDVPMTIFTAGGITPQVFSAQGMGAQMGEQTWSNPMALDVPLGIIDANMDALAISYGNGVGNSNTWSINSGEDIGWTVYYNSKDIVKLFEEAEDAGGSVTVEGNGYRLFACPLPFSVAENSLVYCSHLKNQNVSGEEGIWASGSTLYLRIADEHSGGDYFEKLATLIEKIASNCNYYNPMSPVGVDPDNFLDFFICVTASASYRKQGKKFSLTLANGTHTLLYLKISDYIGLVSELWAPDPTPIANMGALYYTSALVNAMQFASVDLAIHTRFNDAAALGKDAVAEHGGAVGENAQETYGGGAVGYFAKAATGGAVGVLASSINGQGGAVGMNSTAYDGGAVGYAAITSHGCAIGRYAECKDSHGDPINAIQLGSGTNQNPYSMRVYNIELLTSSGYIPLPLITASYSAASADDQAAFKQALGIS